jgi:hypothetical protein
MVESAGGQLTIGRTLAAPAFAHQQPPVSAAADDCFVRRGLAEPTIALATRQASGTGPIGASSDDRIRPISSVPPPRSALSLSPPARRAGGRSFWAKRSPRPVGICAAAHDRLRPEGATGADAVETPALPRATSRRTPRRRSRMARRAGGRIVCPAAGRPNRPLATSPRRWIGLRPRTSNLPIVSDRARVG